MNAFVVFMIVMTIIPTTIIRDDDDDDDENDIHDLSAECRCRTSVILC